MIVDGKPVVMGSRTVKDPNGYDIMTIYIADKNGYRAISKVAYRGLSKEERRKQALLKSSVGK